MRMKLSKIAEYGVCYAVDECGKLKLCVNMENEISCISRHEEFTKRIHHVFRIIYNTWQIRTCTGNWFRSRSKGPAGLVWQNPENRNEANANQPLCCEKSNLIKDSRHLSTV
jgi:hypothetical protein